MRIITYRNAIHEALVQEMSRDPSVFVYGIGVPDFKGIFGSTSGLAEQFGADRCFDTPLAEDTMTGFGLGAAINGMRPVHVHMRADFMLLAVNQIANMISSYAYASAGKLKVPLVIRAVIGRGWGQGFQHSKSAYSIFAHFPGLKVAVPATPGDAKGLLISAIRDDNPVIVMEHRLLYDVFGDVPEDPYGIPLGEAHVLRPGKDVTVVAVSWMSVEAMKAAEVMQKRGISVEVIDPRTIVPLDEDIIAKSVTKTGRCIVADNDWLNCGFSAEVAARVSQLCFKHLKSPVARLGYAPTPCPCTRPLENCFYPNAVDIIRTIEKQLGLSPTDLSEEDFYSYEHRFKGPF
ncbi:MAG: alpha-ketoacid dehydrogenase subunit beta [Chloroflexi bacterium]|nr:alpha-ketoacid dehydrogenase subunit beta [Chloroflexota bacterium]